MSAKYLDTLILIHGYEILYIRQHNNMHMCQPVIIHTPKFLILDLAAVLVLIWAHYKGVADEILKTSEEKS